MDQNYVFDMLYRFMGTDIVVQDSKGEVERGWMLAIFGYKGFELWGDVDENRCHSKFVALSDITGFGIADGKLVVVVS